LFELVLSSSGKKGDDLKNLWEDNPDFYGIRRSSRKRQNSSDSKPPVLVPQVAAQKRKKPVKTVSKRRKLSSDDDDDSSDEERKRFELHSALVLQWNYKFMLVREGKVAKCKIFPFDLHRSSRNRTAANVNYKEDESDVDDEMSDEDEDELGEAQNGETEEEPTETIEKVIEMRLGKKGGI